MAKDMQHLLIKTISKDLILDYISSTNTTAVPISVQDADPLSPIN